MTFRWPRSAISLFVPMIMAFGCGGDATRVPSPGAMPAANGPATASGVDVAGRLAQSVAAPAALVVLEPQSGIDVPVKAEPAIMDQAGYEFLPAFLLAQTGQNVQFRNSEDVLHNIRVTETSQQKPIFNVATPPFGSYEHKFGEAGLYSVSCDIHTSMRASILVTATPYTATTAEDGSFTMSNVKPGKYNLTVYAGAEPVKRSVEVKSQKTNFGVIQ